MRARKILAVCAIPAHSLVSRGQAVTAVRCRSLLPLPSSISSIVPPLPFVCAEEKEGEEEQAAEEDVEETGQPSATNWG